MTPKRYQPKYSITNPVDEVIIMLLYVTVTLVHVHPLCDVNVCKGDHSKITIICIRLIQKSMYKISAIAYLDFNVRLICDVC